MSDQFHTLERGVYWALALKNGCRQVYAVDSLGNEVRRYRITIPSRGALAVEALWDHLDVVDPPRLQLVTDRPRPSPPEPAPRRGWADAYDPYNPPPLLSLEKR